MRNPSEATTEELSMLATLASGMPSLSYCASLWAVLENRLGNGWRPLYWGLAYVIALAIAATASMDWVVGHYAGVQEARNDLLKQEVSMLDKQIYEVKIIHEQIQGLLARKQVIESLQRDRNATVLDFSAVSASVPIRKISMDWDGYASDLRRSGRRMVLEELVTKPLSIQEFSLVRAAWEHFRGIRLKEMDVEGGRGVLRGETYSAGNVVTLMRNLNYAGYASRLLYLEAVSGGASNSPSRLKSFEIEYRRASDAEHAFVKSSPSPRIPSNSVISPLPPEDASVDWAGNIFSLIAILAVCGAIFLIGKHVRRRWCCQRQRAVDVISENWWSRLLISLQEIDHAEPDTWPLGVRLFILVEIFVLVLGVSFYAVVSGEVDALREKSTEEVKLKEEFLAKKRVVVNRDVYIAQLNEIDKEFGSLLKQLPSHFVDYDMLLEINQAALGRGLTIQRMHPVGDVILHEFYATQRWSIQLSGEFNEMGEFVTDIGKLPRIIALPKYRLSLMPGAKKGEQPLFLQATLETYRYLDEEEMFRQRQAAQKAKKNVDK